MLQAERTLHQALIAKRRAWVRELLSGRKTLHTSPIVLNNRTPQDWYRALLALDHVTLDTKLRLLVELNKRDNSLYRFSLLADELGTTPVFGYVSGGPALRLVHEKLPLEQQRITSPYYYTYDDDGYFWAYKTPMLENPEKATALRDVNLGLVSFCLEANIRHQTDLFPSIQFQEPELPFAQPEQHPLLSLKFA